MMTRNRWILSLGLCLFLGSCLEQRPGMFGRLPELYEQTAARQRDVDELFSDGSEADTEVQSRVAAFMQSIRAFEKAVKTEAQRLEGQTVLVDATPASGLKPEGAVIAKVKPGLMTTVEIRIPLSQPPATGPAGYLCFLDEDGEAVGKSEAWYDPAVRALRMEVPFAIYSDGEVAPEGSYEHFERAMRLRLVSMREYQADSFEGNTPETLLTIEEPSRNAESDSASKAITTDTAAIAIADSVAEAKAEPAWKGPVLTGKGVGPVMLGVALRSLPERVPGLYDSRRLERKYDEMEEEPMLTATFYLNGKPIMTALGDEQGNLVFMTVESGKIKMEVDGNFYGVGDELQPLMRQKGVEPDPSGAFAATYRGISIAPTPGGAIHTLSIGAVW